MTRERFAPALREEIRSLGASRIREVANSALGRPGVLPFWFGEPDAVTPSFIREAAVAALRAGDTFYHHNLGILPLREELAAYLGQRHPPLDVNRLAITSAGVNALMIAAQALIGPGDRVVAVVPLWPNVTEIPRILGAEVERVALEFDPATGLWQLDLQRLLDALTPGTRAVIVNSPNNPTGWVMTRADQQELLAHCRERGIWVISDEAYERLVFDGSTQAPSLLDISDAEDLLMVANTFSKAWQMTGWRLGWLVAPAVTVPDLGKLIEYNTSCAPGFIQQAALVALREGEESVHDFVAELALRRDALVSALRAIAGVEVGPPPGAMYLFFRLRGERDSLGLAKRLVAEAGLGLAPGSAFGPEGEGFLRWCFARPAGQLVDGAERLRRFLAGGGAGARRD